MSYLHSAKEMLSQSTVDPLLIIVLPMLTCVIAIVWGCKYFIRIKISRSVSKNM